MKKIIKNSLNFFGVGIYKRTTPEYRFGLKFPEYNGFNNYKVLVTSKNYIENLKKAYNDVSIKPHKNGFLVCFLNFKIYVETAEEFYILNEVFVEKDYNFYANGPCILVDIGMNIGIASLYFSSLKWVEKIYGFEPITETFNQAQYNFSLNKDTCKVLSANNFGLGKNNREALFEFDNNYKGNTGVRGELSSRYSNNPNTKKITVKIKDTSSILSNIIKENPHKKIIVKMDCEGAEYEIFENLSASGLIENIEMFLIEWHDKGAEAIEAILKDKNFNYISKPLTHNAGMIYASKVCI